MDLIYPSDAASRSQWIEERRPPRHARDSDRPYAYFVEEERSSEGEIVPVATVLLTNRECPWRCVMCDLWKNTLTETVAPGSITRQIQFALDSLPAARQIKLYNSGSFFDARAIPPEDDLAIAGIIAHLERVIVECHPSLIGSRCLRFSQMLDAPLEVAMGLETAHPAVLQKLNKGITVSDFARAAECLASNRIAMRAFILVQPPFMRSSESLEWAQRSIDFAFECGATAVSLIPTRDGNGAMEALASLGEFCPPALATLESAVEYGLSKGNGRVFADLWDVENNPRRCDQCWPARITRLQQINHSQQISVRIDCAKCGGAS